MSLVRHVDSPDDLTRLLDAKATGLVVLDFFGIHCAPCHMIAPVIDAFSKSVSRLLLPLFFLNK